MAETITLACGHSHEADFLTGERTVWCPQCEVGSRVKAYQPRMSYRVELETLPKPWEKDDA